MNHLKESIKAEARNLGFSFIGFTEPNQTPHFNNYLDWINDGGNADLGYLSKDYVIQGRRQPESLLKGARSVVVAGIHYLPQIQSRDITSVNNLDRGWIAAYGCLSDYHRTLKKMLRSLAESINEMGGIEVKFRIFIDSGPVMEKDFAMQAGLGWIGKNSLLITPQFGSYCLLGCLFLDLEIPPDSPMGGDVCNGCEICVQACPTQCINSNRTINAGQCISYQTVENQFDIPEGLGEKMGGWIFGCDICQMICPVNQKIVENSPKKSVFDVPVISQRVNFSEVETINAEKFEETYSTTPVFRIGLIRFRRNVMNASRNQQGGKPSS